MNHYKEKNSVLHAQISLLGLFIIIFLKTAKWKFLIEPYIRENKYTRNTLFLAIRENKTTRKIWSLSLMKVYTTVGSLIAEGVGKQGIN